MEVVSLPFIRNSGVITDMGESSWFLSGFLNKIDLLFIKWRIHINIRRIYILIAQSLRSCNCAFCSRIHILRKNTLRTPRLNYLQNSVQIKSIINRSQLDKIEFSCLSSQLLLAMIILAPAIICAL